MAFDKTNFNPIGGQSRPGKGPAIFGYSSTADALAAVKGSGYFDEVADLVKAGDGIWFIDVGAAGDWITIAAVSAAGVVTSETADINSA